MNTNVRVGVRKLLNHIFRSKRPFALWCVCVASMRLERGLEVNYPSKWSHFCWCSFSSSINSIDKPFRENERWKPDAQITLAFFCIFTLILQGVSKYYLILCSKLAWTPCRPKQHWNNGDWQMEWGQVQNREDFVLRSRALISIRHLPIFDHQYCKAQVLRLGIDITTPPSNNVSDLS